MGKHGSIVKRITDIFLSIVLLTISSPLLLISIIAIKLNSKGPAFFVQERIGYNGKPFKMIKLRGMIDNAEALGPLLTQEDDPRLTPIGKVLRRISIDEIPQCINVLKGDMSIIGPRPEVPGIARHYSDEEKRVFSFKPGITGIAQVNGRQTLSPAQRVRMEIEYYSSANIFSDLKVALKTPIIILSNEGNI
ncbi:MAG: sugar transferase [Chlorobi bacterium]|nr:sugar transferase [Chlorobiota bacterium]